MLALQLVAIAFLALSAAFVFGPPLLMYGPRMLPVLAKDEQARFALGFFVSAAVLTVLAPQFKVAVSSGGGAMTLIMADLFTMQFSPV